MKNMLTICLSKALMSLKHHRRDQLQHLLHMLGHPMLVEAMVPPMVGTMEDILVDIMVDTQVHILGVTRADSTDQHPWVDTLVMATDICEFNITYTHLFINQLPHPPPYLLATPYHILILAFSSVSQPFLPHLVDNTPLDLINLYI